MDRRTVLRALSVGATGISGCTGTQFTGSEATTRELETTTSKVETTTTEASCSPSAVPEERQHLHTDYGLGIVAENIDHPAISVVGENWGSKLRTDEMAEEDEAFVEETDFEQSVVLVVQYTKSSGGNELRIVDYEFDGDVLRADLCVVTRGGPNNAPTTNLFVRLDHDRPVPSTVEAQIDRGTETVTVSSE